MSKIPVGLQMYTLRDETEKDFVGTFRKVAEMGYAGVEFAGFGGLSAQETKQMLHELKLKPAAAHIALDDLLKDLNQWMDYNLEIDNKRIVVPYLQVERRDSKESWLATADILNKMGSELKQRGMQLLYHHHAFEFEKIDNQYAFDLFFAAMEPELVKMELDVYWLQRGGVNPADYIRKYASRVELMHIKDMANDADQSFEAVGSGILNWSEIFKAAEEVKPEWYLVEQDECNRPSLDCVRSSIQYLKQQKIA